MSVTHPFATAIEQARQAHIVPVTSYGPHVAIAYPAQPFQCLAIAYIARQQDLLYLARHQQLLELERKVMGAYWDV